MLHAAHSPIKILAHLLIAALFVIVRVRNALRWPEVLERMRELKVPVPEAALPLALAVQLAGAGRP